MWSQANRTRTHAHSNTHTHTLTQFVLFLLFSSSFHTWAHQKPHRHYYKMPVHMQRRHAAKTRDMCMQCMCMLACNCIVSSSSASVALALQKCARAPASIDCIGARDGGIVGNCDHKVTFIYGYRAACGGPGLSVSRIHARESKNSTSMCRSRLWHCRAASPYCRKSAVRSKTQGAMRNILLFHGN